MNLPDWLTRLLTEGPHRVQVDDRDFERDQAAIDAMLEPYRTIRYPERPPDPRIIDPSRLAKLRKRLLDPYAYRWRQVEAVDEIVDALFAPVIQSDGTRYALTTQKIFLNDEGHSPGPASRHHGDEFKEHHYITVQTLRLGAFLTSYEEAVRLFNQVLPDWGFTARVMPGGTEVCLERDAVQGAWIGGGPIATLIVAAMLDLLAHAPYEAKAWRTI